MRGFPNRLFAAAAAEFHGLRRDKVALFFILVLPVALVFLIGLAFGSAGSEIPVGVFDESDAGASRRLVARLADQPGIEIETYATREELSDAVTRQYVTFGVVIPRSYADAPEGDDVVTVDVISGGATDLALVRSSVGAAVSEEVVSSTAARVGADAAGVPEARARAVASQVASRAPLAGVRTETLSGEQIAGGIGRVAYTQLVLFLVITGLTSAGTFTELRRNRVAHRLLAVPARTGELEVGLVSARFVTIALQALYLVLLTAWLFGVDWGNLVATSLVTLALAACVSGLSVLAGTIYRTPEQAGAIGAPIGMALGMLGGAMWPLEIVPVPLQVFGHLLPTAWAVEAYNEIIAGAAGVVDVLGYVVVLLGMATALFALAALRFRRVFAG